MRCHRTYEMSVHFDPDDEDNPPAYLVEWGGYKRRRKFQPESVLIKWRKHDRQPWELYEVMVFGRDLTTMFTTIGISYAEGGRYKGNEQPDWLQRLVETANEHVGKIE